MRADANKIAFRAIRNILDGAKPFEVEIAGTRVTCAVSRASAPPWPERGVQGLEKEVDGPWPAPVDVECRWEGGLCNLQVQCGYWPGQGRYRQQTGVRVRLRDRAQTIVWITLPPIIGDLEDGKSAKIHASVSTFKQKQDVDPELGSRLNTAMRKLLDESGLPLVAASKAEVCAIEVPSGACLSGAELAFRRLVQLALLRSSSSIAARRRRSVVAPSSTCGAGASISRRSRPPTRTTARTTRTMTRRTHAAPVDATGRVGSVSRSASPSSRTEGSGRSDGRVIPRSRRQ